MMRRAVCMLGAMAGTAAALGENYTSKGPNTVCRHGSTARCQSIPCTENYDMVTQTTAEICEKLCDATKGCTGFEFGGGRCETWKKVIDFDSTFEGFECFAKDPPTSENQDVWVSFKMTIPFNFTDFGASGGDMANFKTSITGVLKTHIDKMTGVVGDGMKTIDLSQVYMGGFDEDCFDVIVPPQEQVSAQMVYSSFRKAGDDMQTIKSDVEAGIDTLLQGGAFSPYYLSGAKTSITGRMFHFEEPEALKEKPNSGSTGGSSGDASSSSSSSTSGGSTSGGSRSGGSGSGSSSTSGGSTSGDSSTSESSSDGSSTSGKAVGGQNATQTDGSGKACFNSAVVLFLVYYSASILAV